MLLIILLVVIVADVWLMKSLAEHYAWLITVGVVLLSTLIGWLFVRQHKKQVNWPLVSQWDSNGQDVLQTIHHQLQHEPARIAAEHRELAITQLQVSAIMPAVLLILLPGIITDVLGMLVVLHARFMVSHLKTLPGSKRDSK
jgi:UPF0716 family protein affecting phage T7 exclusion